MRSVRHYEVMIILDPSQDERTVAPSLDKFLEIVRKENGTVEKVDIWGDFFVSLYSSKLFEISRLFTEI